VPSDQARLYQRVQIGYVERGVAPHYVEIAKSLDWSTDHAREVLHQVVELGLSMWLHPGTDLIVSCAPFSSLPTLYRISIDGAPHGYAQCGLESLAVSWLFPGREVRIDSLCPDCGEPIGLVMRDGRVLGMTPESAVAQVNVPFSKWRGQLPLV
jgi:Alkylmercury lyase